MSLWPLQLLRTRLILQLVWVLLLLLHLVLLLLYLRMGCSGVCGMLLLLLLLLLRHCRAHLPSNMSRLRRVDTAKGITSVIKSWLEISDCAC